LANINIELGFILQRRLKRKNIILEADTVSEALRQCQDEFGLDLKSHLFFLNSQKVNIQDNRKLQDCDILKVISPLAGG